MRQWGQKIIVSNDLEKVIVTREEDPEVRKNHPLAVYEFALNARNVDFNKAKYYIDKAKIYRDDRADIFYIIDHTNLTWYHKLYLKMYYMI